MTIYISYCRAIAVLLVTISVFSISCVRDYDMERKTETRGTLGEILFDVWKKDAVRSPNNGQSKGELLEKRRADFIDAVDAIAPEEELGAIDDFLRQSMVLVHDDWLTDLTRKSSEALVYAAADDDLLNALAQPSIAHSSKRFISPLYHNDFLGTVTSYPAFGDIAHYSMGVVLRLDGLSDSGQIDPNEHDIISELLRRWKASYEDGDEPLEDDHFSVVMRDLLLRSDGRYRVESDGEVLPLYVAKYDHRGLPVVRRVSGSVVAPFVDHDGDGLADIDEHGYFLMLDGTMANIPGFLPRDESDGYFIRDIYGRALGSDDQPVFEYIDIRESGLSYILRQLPAMAKEDVFYHAVEAAPAMLGPRVLLSDEDGDYSGYSTNYASFDIVLSLLEIINTENLPDSLRNIAELFNRSSRAIATLAKAIEQMTEAVDKLESAQLSPEQTLVYDLLPIVYEIASTPGLWADILEALRDPIIKRAGESMATLLRYKDKRTIPLRDGPYDSCFQSCKINHSIGTNERFDCIRACPMDELFSEPMDFSLPESESNRSVFQRMLHLLRDTSGTPYSMDIVESRLPSGMALPANMPPMITLPDSAGAFTKAVAGDLHLADYISDEFTQSDIGQLLDILNDILPGTIDNSTVAGILSRLSGLFGAHLDMSPTPDQITRLFNQPNLRFQTDDGSIVLAVANPRCKDGYVMAEHHADGLYAAEAAGMIDTLYPLARAFSKHNKEHLLGQAYAIVHDHYSSRTDLYFSSTGVPSPMSGSNIVSYEAALLEIMEEGYLFEAVYEFAHSMKNIKASGGVDVEESIRELIERGSRVDASISNRRHENFVQLPDGEVVQPISHFHIILQAMDEISNEVSSNDSLSSHVSDFIGGVLKSMTPAQRTLEDDAYELSDPGILALLGSFTDYLANKAEEKQASGALDDWLSTTVIEDIEKIWQSRELGLLLHIGFEAMRDESERTKVNDFIVYLFDNSHHQEQAAMAAFTMLVNTVNTRAESPWIKFMAELLDPERQWESKPYGGIPLATHLAIFIQGLIELDPDNVGMGILHRSVSSDAEQGMPVKNLSQIISAYFRPVPDSNEPWTQDDYRYAMEGFSQWLNDDRHGVERLYKLIDMRRR